MNSQKAVKPKRHKKKKPRTEVSSESESEAERSETTPDSPKESKATPGSKSTTNAEVSTAFNRFYLQRATVEFAEDLDRIRNADDFKDDALPLLINALQQGTELFSVEEKRKVIEAPKAEQGSRVRNDREK